MKTYTVEVKSTYWGVYTVDARSKKEAIKNAKKGNSYDYYGSDCHEELWSTAKVNEC